MNIEAELGKGQSKLRAQAIANWIGSSPDRFFQLAKVIISGDYVLAQRAAWVLAHISSENSFLVLPHLKAFLLLLDKPVHDAVKRNIARICDEVQIPASLQGMAADVFFRLLSNPHEAIAIRVFSMQALYNICLHEPDLKNELKLLIEMNMEHGGPAIISRGSKLLKGLKKL